MATAVPPVNAVPEPRTEPSQLRLFWRRFAKNKLAVIALVILVLMGLAAIFAGKIAPGSPTEQSLLSKLKAPGITTDHVKHWLGTDNLGRDILSRMLFGARISLTVGFVSCFIAIGLGTLIGSVAGYYGGWIDNLLMRFVDMLLAIPVLPILLVVVGVFHTRSLYVIIALISVFSWMSVARLVRGEFLSLRQRDFVEAARAQGAKDGRIIWKHILPQTGHVIVVAAILRVAGGMLTESTLSFLGLGVRPPTVSWGSMLYENKDFLRTAWWGSTFPGLAIFVAVLCFYLVGDGLRDALDPKLKNK